MEMRGLRKNSRIPIYMIYPRFLDGLQELTDTEKNRCIHLLNRARLSMKNKVNKLLFCCNIYFYAVLPMLFLIFKNPHTLKQLVHDKQV